MFSGIQVMGQKIALMWYDIQGQDTALLEKKYNLQRYFNELLYTAEYTTGCEEGEVIDFINETKDTLKSLSLTEFSETEASYIQAINYIKDELQDACSVA